MTIERRREERRRPLGDEELYRFLVTLADIKPESRLGYHDLAERVVEFSESVAAAEKFAWSGEQLTTTFSSLRYFFKDTYQWAPGVPSRQRMRDYIDCKVELANLFSQLFDIGPTNYSKRSWQILGGKEVEDIYKGLHGWLEVKRSHGQYHPIDEVDDLLALLLKRHVTTDPKEQAGLEVQIASLAPAENPWFFQGAGGYFVFPVNPFYKMVEEQLLEKNSPLARYMKIL